MVRAVSAEPFLVEPFLRVSTLRAEERLGLRGSAMGVLWLLRLVGVHFARVFWLGWGRLVLIGLGLGFGFAGCGVHDAR